MKRTLIAAAWIAGSTIPLILATVFVFGCCVLPFHGLLHRAMPFCHAATELMSGAHHHDDDAHSSTPARAKQEPAKRFFTELSPRFSLTPIMSASDASAPRVSIGDRSFITLGATRCDRDVGLHVVLATFLI